MIIIIANSDAKTTRYGTIDFLRGITLISMIMFHMCWDLRFIFGVEMNWFTDTPGLIWERSICIPFILLSGFCITLGNSQMRKIKRGFIISVCGMIVTFVSIVFISDGPIYFGVLTFIGFAMILFGALERMLRKLNPYAMLVVNILLFVIFYNTGIGVIRLSGLFEIKIPEILYSNMFTTFLGFPFPAFISSDYFPVLPWIFMYGAGYYIGRIFKLNDLMKYLEKPKKTFINFLGKHALPIYMIHQPVIYGILMVFFWKR